MGLVTLPHTLTPGTTENVTHVQENDQAIVDVVNGAIDTVNLATGAVTALKLADDAAAQWRDVVMWEACRIPNPVLVEAIVIEGATVELVTSSGAAFGVRPVAPEHYALSGKATEFRLVGVLMWGGDSNGQGLTIRLRDAAPRTMTTDQYAGVTIGTLRATMFGAGASANEWVNEVTSAFTLPAGFNRYVLTAQWNGGATAEVIASIRLQARAQ